MTEFSYHRGEEIRSRKEEQRVQKPQIVKDISMLGVRSSGQLREVRRQEMKSGVRL